MRKQKRQRIGQKCYNRVGKRQFGEAVWGTYHRELPRERVSTHERAVRGHCR